MDSKQLPKGGYREMLLLELIEEYAPVYPEGADWLETARFLYDEEPDHMASLTASLAAKGWREPIRVSGPEDLEEGQRPLVLNGTHRVAIALREGLISVPVATQNEIIEPKLEHFTALKVELISGELSEEEDWSVFDALRSFALNEDIWLTSDVGLGGRTSWELNYDAIEDPALFAALKRRARSELKRAIPGRSFRLTVWLEPNSWEDSAE